MRMPGRCPACPASLQVVALSCPDCSTRVEGVFHPCPVCRLEGEDRTLLELFLRVRGNAKEIERVLGVSYPTVRARLDRIWSLLSGTPDSPQPDEPSPLQILADLREGKIRVPEAIQMLRQRGRLPSVSS